MEGMLTFFNFKHLSIVLGLKRKKKEEPEGLNEYIKKELTNYIWHKYFTLKQNSLLSIAKSRHEIMDVVTMEQKFNLIMDKIVETWDDKRNGRENLDVDIDLNTFNSNCIEIMKILYISTTKGTTFDNETHELKVGGTIHGFIQEIHYQIEFINLKFHRKRLESAIER